MFMTFGKYRGEHISDVPSDYLQWAFEECDQLPRWVLEEIRRELDQRGRRARRTERPPEEPSKPRAHPPVDWSTVITKWHREMSMRFHPDRGGSVEAMQAINHATDRLRELVGV